MKKIYPYDLKMKLHSKSFILNLIIKAIIVFFFILMFLFPYASYKGASSGLLLWFLNVLPTLLPFIIISNLMIRLNIAGQISRFLYPVLGKIFRVSKDGCYPILIGFLCGIPMGAKTTSDLVSDNKINKKEGQFLLSMCNNASPIFIMSYIAINQLKAPKMRIPLFIILYGSSMLSAGVYRCICNILQKGRKKAQLSVAEIRHPSYMDNNSSKYTGNKDSSHSFSFDILDSCIMNGFEVVTKIGGYIILFSILAQIVNEIGPEANIYKASLMGLLEITTGIDQVCKIGMAKKIKIVLAAVLASFGGLSGMAQTKSVLGESRLSIKTYFIVKLLNAIITFMLATIYVSICKIN